MSKAILVMDMPKSCEECPCCYLTEGCYSDICQVTRNGLEEGYEKGRPNWCPLHKVPKKVKVDYSLTEYQIGVRSGYNVCIDEIMGGC